MLEYERHQVIGSLFRSDDQWHKRKLEEQVKSISRDKLSPIYPTPTKYGTEIRFFKSEGNS